MIASRWDVVEIHIGRHKVAGARLCCSAERRQVYVAEQLLRNIGRVVVATTVCCSVTCEVLNADDDGVGAELLALKSSDLCTGHGGAEVRVLARAFNNATPASITRDIDHRRERPLNASRARVLTSETLCLFFDAGVPRRSHRERNRECSPKSVDHIETE